MTRLTDTQIASFKSKKTHQLHRDSGAPGLGLYVGTSGVKKFRYIYRFGAKGGQYISIGTYPHMTLVQARQKATDLEAARLEGHDPKGFVIKPKDATKLDELLDDHERRAPPETRRSLRSLYRPIRMEFGGFALRDIKATALKRWLEQNYEHRQGSARTLLRNLSAQITDALTPLGRERWVIHPEVQNIVEGLGRKLEWKSKRKKGSHAVNWEGDKIADLIAGMEAAYAKATPDQRRGLLVLELCLFTGARPSEIASLEWDEVKEWRGTKAAEKLHHKTEDRSDEPTLRRIILGPEAVAVIEKAEALRVPGSRWVFSQSPSTLRKKAGRASTEISRDYITKFTHYRDMVERECGFHWNPYNLRSLHINHAVDDNGEGMLESVSKNVGHSTTDTTKTYYRRSSDRKLTEAALAADSSFGRLKRSGRPDLTVVEGGIAA